METTPLLFYVGQDHFLKISIQMNQYSDVLITECTNTGLIQKPNKWPSGTCLLLYKCFYSTVKITEQIKLSPYT